MEIGERIRYFRTLRKMTKEQLAEISGIGLSTIGKYESGDRNPKPEQLLKISEAFGISINVFLDLDIKTVSDLLSLVFKMDEQLSLNFEAQTDESGEYDYRTLKLSFQNDAVNQKLLTYMLAIKKRNEYLSSATSSVDDSVLADIDANIADLRNHLIDDNTIIQKDEVYNALPAEKTSFTPDAEPPRSQELSSMLRDVLFDCSANELELIVKTAQTIKDCLRKQAE